MRFPKTIFFKLTVCLLLSVCLAAIAAAQKSKLSTADFKQLARTAEEIPAMRLPNPADLGTSSKTAMIPISSGKSLQNIEIPVETGGDFKIMLYAQLPGAYNLGHKTGWCHSSGMRDPAQTTDASRNTNMNSYAAR